MKNLYLQFNTPIARTIHNFILLAAIAFILSPQTGFSATVAVFSSKEDSKIDERFDRILREGRELIDKEEWAKAVAKLSEIACDCAENKNVDAALYWLAFAYKKQRMFKDSEAMLDRLLKNYPGSTWSYDARVLKYEINTSALDVASTRSISAARPTADRTTNLDAAGSTIEATSPETPIDREDEIKLAAFQSLLSGDPKRGIEIMANMLKPDSTSSETLKCEIVRVFRSQRAVRVASYGSFSTFAPFDVAVGAEMLPSLREALIKSFQGEKSLKVRTEIIYTLSRMADEATGNFLSQVYKSSAEKEIKKAVINSYGSSLNLAVASANKSSFANRFSLDRLIEIIKSEKDSELRLLAFNGLRRLVGWSAVEGMVETLSQVYDTESDESFKTAIIQAFGLSNQNRATMKVLDVARRDKSDKMRLEAIRALSSSKNPEVLKFLEDLIK